ncbi:MAG: DUF4145 domain-containing protein [Dehalococcoidales bacterium]
MLNPKYQRYAERLRELIEEGNTVAKLAKPSSVGTYIQGEDNIQAQSWLTKVRNILGTVFGFQSPHYHHFEELIPEHGVRHLAHSYDVYPIVGVLNGALDDLEKGYLLGQEFLIAGEVFDSILEQAKQLMQSGYKDPAAVLARVVLEDALKRLARGEGIDDNLKASSINDELKKRERYPQSQWRFIQAWLDIGNAAAHGNVNEYSADDVNNLIKDLERFLVTEFHG